MIKLTKISKSIIVVLSFYQFNTMFSARASNDVDIDSSENVTSNVHANETQMSQFDILVDEYENSFDSMPFRQHIELHSISKTIGNVEGLTILDIGCGSGYYPRYFRNKGSSQVTGIDISNEMITYAQKKESVTHLGIKYIVQDATRIESDTEIGNNFDLVTAIYVLPYARNEEMLKGFCKTAYNAVSSKKGRFIAAVTHHDFNREPNYYKQYGFDLTSKNDLNDGDSILLTASLLGKEFCIESYYWSKEAHENALYNAGFNKVTWIKPELSDEGRALKEEEYWSRYLTNPHAMVIVATF